MSQPFVLSPSTKLRTGSSKPVVSLVEPDTAGMLRTGYTRGKIAQNSRLSLISISTSTNPSPR